MFVHAANKHLHLYFSCEVEKEARDELDFKSNKVVHLGKKPSVQDFPFLYPLGLGVFSFYKKNAKRAKLFNFKNASSPHIEYSLIVCPLRRLLGQPVSR